ESVREAVGRGVKLSLRRRVQLEVKGDRVESRVLALASHRAYLLTARLPSKLEHSFSYLEIQGLGSHKAAQVSPDQLVLEYERGAWNLRLGSTEEVDEVIAHIGSCLQRICPLGSPVKLMRKVSVKPPDRMGALQALWDQQGPADLGPCGGFSHQYWCVCDLLAVPYREEVQWDVDTIYLSQDTRELNLQDFTHLENRDLVAIVTALEYNQWFTKVSSKDVKLVPGRAEHVCEHLLRVVARSSRLEELVLENAGLRSAQLAKLPMGLKLLNLSRTSTSPKGVNSLCQALGSNPAVATSLKHLDLSGNSMRGDDLQRAEPAQVLSWLGLRRLLSPRALLLGLGCNPNLSEVSLDLSGCELRSGGSQILEGCIAEIPNISCLDISDNGLDADLPTLLVWLAKNRSIRHLSLGKNFSNIKSKWVLFRSPSQACWAVVTALLPFLCIFAWSSRNVAQVLDSLVHMIQEEESPLGSLSLADSKLKGDLSRLLNALGSNTSLTRLDISGNAMGDMGAKMLAKALQINTKLRNYTIRFMPVPIVDAAQALKTNAEKTEDALLKMEQYLLRNHETRKYLQEQAYRLQQGIVMTTTQQMMDTMCVRVQDHLNSLCFSESSSVQEDVKLAENLMRDARSSKTLEPCPHPAAAQPVPPEEGRATGPCGGAIQDQLESMAGEVARVVEEQLQSVLVLMVDAAQRLCPHVMAGSNLRQELLAAGAARMSVPRSFISSTLLEQSGMDILNKISEVQLNVASLLSDRILDEILASLSRSQRTLADHVTRKSQPLVRQEAQMETEVLDEVVLKDQNPDLEPCVMTPQAKRKSILVRMMRPISVAFEMEFDLDKALEEVPAHVEDPPPPSAPPPELRPQSASVGELPPVELSTLEHRTKGRPRPVRRTKPSREAVGGATAPPEAEQDSFATKLDEGLDDFFYKKVIKLGFRRSSRGSSSGLPEAPEKKRESRRSGFFSLIKSRTSRSEKSPGAAAAAPPQSSASPCPAPPPTAACVSPVMEEAMRASTPPPPQQELHPDHSHSVMEKAWPAGEAAEQKEVQQEDEQEEKNTHVRHLGVPVMGLDLLAEMKARQEKMAV
ncbi:unnamed protein product, partial [Tetraodon nigroviridis]